MSEIASRSEGAGAPLVLIHGVGGDSSNWDDIVPQLAPKFRVITVDLRGHGRSPPIRSACTVKDLARDVTQVMEALEVRSAHVAGFSLGGQVAQSIALEWPQRVEKLALVSTVAGRTDAERAGAASRLQLLKDEGLAAIAAANRDRWFTDDFQKRHPAKVELRVRQLMQTDAQSYLHAFTVFATTELAPRLGEIRAPTLIVTGEHDAAATPRMAQLMHKQIENSRLRILPGLRHSLLIESPGQVAGLLVDFL